MYAKDQPIVFKVKDHDVVGKHDDLGTFPSSLPPSLPPTHLFFSCCCQSLTTNYPSSLPTSLRRLIPPYRRPGASQARRSGPRPLPHHSRLLLKTHLSFPPLPPSLPPSGDYSLRIDDLVPLKPIDLDLALCHTTQGSLQVRVLYHPVQRQESEGKEVAREIGREGGREGGSYTTHPRLATSACVLPPGAEAGIRR